MSAIINACVYIVMMVWKRNPKIKKKKKKRKYFHFNVPFLEIDKDDKNKTKEITLLLFEVILTCINKCTHTHIIYTID